MGGLQDFSVSRSPLGTNLSFELGWTLDWTGLDIGDLGSQGFGDRAWQLDCISDLKFHCYTNTDRSPKSTKCLSLLNIPIRKQIP